MKDRAVRAGGRGDREGRREPHWTSLRNEPSVSNCCRDRIMGFRAPSPPSDCKTSQSRLVSSLEKVVIYKVRKRKLLARIQGKVYRSAGLSPRNVRMLNRYLPWAPACVAELVHRKEPKPRDFKNEAAGAPGWRSRLSVRLRPGHDLAVREFEPRVRLWADGSEPGACFGFCVSLSLCPSPVHALSLSVPKINKR